MSLAFNAVDDWDGTWTLLTALGIPKGPISQGSLALEYFLCALYSQQLMQFLFMFTSMFPNIDFTKLKWIARCNAGQIGSKVLC